MTDRHLDLDVLADVLVGEAAEPDAVHARSCPTCAAQLAELTASDGPVVAALAALPEPELPPGLAGRLELALERERRSLTAGRTADVLPLATRRRLWLPWAGGVAAAAAAVVGAVVLLHQPHRSSETSSAGRAATAPEVAVPTSETGTRYGKDVAVYRTAVPRILQGAPVPVSPAAGSTDTAPLKAAGGDLAGLRAPLALADCLASLRDPGDDRPPLGLDYATFEGSPALVVVSHSDQAGHVDVYVVGPGCSRADAQLRFFVSVTAPPGTS